MLHGNDDRYCSFPNSRKGNYTFHSHDRLRTPAINSNVELILTTAYSLERIKQNPETYISGVLFY